MSSRSAAARPARIREIEVDEAAAAWIAVLDIAADETDADRLRHRLGDVLRRRAVAGFEIGGDRHGAARDDRGDAVEHAVAAQPLAVAATARIGDAGAGRGNRWKAGGRHQRRAAGIPRIGQNDHVAGAMLAAEGRGLVAQGRGGVHGMLQIKADTRR